MRLVCLELLLHGRVWLLLQRVCVSVILARYRKIRHDSSTRGRLARAIANAISDSDEQYGHQLRRHMLLRDLRLLD